MTDIAELLVATLDVTGTKMSDNAVALIVGNLEEYPAEDVRAALSRCARECKGFVTLADILERLPKNPKAVPADAEEAWSLAVQLLGSASEAQTVVAPTAIMRSFPFGPWDQGDKVGARMAFKAAYPAQLARHGDQWEVVDGTDKASREAAVLEAVQLGRISARQAVRILPGSAQAQALADEERRMLE